MIEQPETDKPLCNKCGGVCLAAGDSFGLTVSVHWGYESTGKDMDRDEWQLCRDCWQDLSERVKPVCSICHKPIGLVMAELDVKNNGCIHKTVEEALEWHATGNFCGYAFAEFKGHQVCEVCYEKLIASFKIPIDVSHYLHPDRGLSPHKWSGDRIVSGLGLTPIETLIHETDE